MRSPFDLALGSLVLTDDDHHALGAGTASDAALVGRVRAGDASAFGALVRRFERKVLQTAWRMLGDRQDAMDAAQETFIRVHKYLGGFDLEEDFGAWLHGIVINVSRDAARRRSARAGVRGAAGDTERNQPDVDQPDPEAVAISRDTRRQLSEALATLTEKERMAFVLRDLEGLPTEEVARRAGVSPTTVRVHICMARKKLKKCFEATMSIETEELA